MMQIAHSGQMTADVEDIDFSTLTDKDILGDKMFKRRHSVIMVTLVNRIATEVDIQKLMEAGMNVARFRLPHQTSKDKIKLIDKIKRATAALCLKYGLKNWPLATCIDLKTRSILTGILEDENTDYIVLNQDTQVDLTTDVSYFDKCNAKKIFIDNLDVATEVTIGMEISIDGDEIKLICTEILNADTLRAVVAKSGKLKHIAVVCFRGFKSSRPFFSRSDETIIKFVTKHQVDGIVINYVEDAEEIKMVKKYIGKKIRRPMIFSGISTEGGLRNIDEIIQESDGIIFSREYLPFTVPASYKFRMNNIQKRIAAKCQQVKSSIKGGTMHAVQFYLLSFGTNGKSSTKNYHFEIGPQGGKPLYLSGGVMQSAIGHDKVVNSELSDVSNAILDGFSGFILRVCENMDYTLDTVRLLDGMCRNIEPYTCAKSRFWRLTDQYMMPVNAAEASVLSCVALANQSKAQVIVLPTVTGRTAQALLQMQPCCLILAVCTNVKVTRMLQMFKSMVPILYSGEPMKHFHLTITARVNFAVEYAVKMDWLHYGDTYAVLKRATDVSSYCDIVNVLTVTISNKPMVECEDDEDAFEEHHDADY